MHLDKVYDRCKHWMDEGFDFESLPDKHRCCITSKVNAAQREQLRLWANAMPASPCAASASMS